MDKTQAKSRINHLKKLINRYRYEYHVLDTQEVSDAVNDSLKHELQALENQFPDLITPDSPTQRVGGEPLKKFKKVNHSNRMISLVDVFSYEELKEWEKRNKKLKPNDKFDYYIELKIDGFAISLIYEDSVLITAATRGNGFIGEDVTMNVKTIEAIPLRLEKNIAGKVEVRGEIYMSKSEFDRINKEQKKKGGKLYANPRNLAAGSIRQLDPKLSASRKLNFFAYELVSGVQVKTKEEEHDVLQELGFKVVKYNKKIKNLEEAEKFYQEWVDKRNKQEFLIDGLVVKVNDNKLRESLGIVGKAPRGMIAYKFPAEQTTTIVKKVDWNVGRTGVLTPLATFEPVQVAGTIVQHATLHNLDEINRLDIKIGDTVIIEKAGDIIPKVVKVLKELRTGKEIDIVIPKKCPVCDSKTVRKEGEVALYCSNKSCFATEIENLIHFVSKKAFDIDGLGEKIIEQLATVGIIKKYSDIFKLKEQDLIGLEGFAQKAIDNLLNSIDNSREITLSRFIYSLGIRHVGEETANILAMNFQSIEKIKKARLEELIEVKDVGEVVAKSIYDYFHDKTKLKEMDSLLEEVVVKKVKKVKTKLAGLTIVPTGTFKHFSRDEIKQVIRDNAGNVSNSVSKNTDFVIAGESAGSKLAKAKELGVKILTEQDFLDKISKSSKQ